MSSSSPRKKKRKGFKDLGNYKCSSIQCSSAMPKITIKKLSSIQEKIDCDHCFCTWTVCTQCQKRFARHNYSRAIKHFKEHDEESKMVIPNMVVNPVFTTTDYQDNESNMHEYNVSTSTKDNETSSVVLTQFTGSSKKYFQDELAQKDGGVLGLVGQAFHGKNSSELASRDEAFTHLKVAKFCDSLTENQQAQFGNIMEDMRKPGLFQCTRPFFNQADINKFYMKSVQSIMKNMPVPDIMIRHEHAYVSLVSVIDHHLGYGLKSDSLSLYNDDVVSDTIKATKYAQKIRDSVKESVEIGSNPLILYLSFWSDDFDAFTHRKTKSIWIKTVTICPPSDQMTSPNYTFLLAIGRKGQNHDLINEIFMKEIKDLERCKVRYCGQSKSNVQVVVKVLSVLYDRPERSAVTLVQHHTALNSRRWGYSAYINQDKFPSCKSCFQKRLRVIIDGVDSSRNARCSSCCDFDMDNSCVMNRALLPSNYPSSQHKDSPLPPKGREVLNTTFLLPVKLSFKWLIQGCEYCFHNFYHKCWSKQEAVVYMKTLNVQESFYKEHIIGKAEKLWSMNINQGNLSGCIKYPSSWNTGIELHQYLDTPMHLLFQGICNSILEMAHSYFTQYKVRTKFLDKSAPLMKKLKTMNCQFCRIETFYGTNKLTAGWIAEHHLGFSRIMISIMVLVGKTSTNEIDHMKDFESMLLAWCCLISRLMTKKKVSTDEIDIYVKVFCFYFKHLRKKNLRLMLAILCGIIGVILSHCLIYQIKLMSLVV